MDKHAEEGEVIPLFQFLQPIIHRKGLKVVAQANGMKLPQLVTQAQGGLSACETHRLGVLQVGFREAQLHPTVS